MIRSVLLCDTADEISALHAVTLGAPDLFVDVSTDAVRAVDSAGRTRPDVIVCRLDMPGFGGLRLLTRLLERSPDSRILVRVGLDDIAVAASCLGAGAHGVIAVEDDAADVLAAIHVAASGAVALTPRVAGALGAGLVAAIDDVDDVRRELGALQHTVAQGTSAKADFLANISHELRTPVTVAKGIAYVLRNPSVGDDDRAEFLEQLQGSLDKLVGIIDEIITMSELERGTFRLTLAEVDLAPLVQGAVDAVRSRHPEVPIEASIAPSLPTVADERRLAGVIEELLDNACRYSPASAPVEISARAMSEGIVVSITDRGEGLDRGVAKRSFDEPFSTGEGVLRKEKAGVGVGLHLARQLVIEHGGTLWTDPLPGGGTRAAFCLPPLEARVYAPPAGAA